MRKICYLFLFVSINIFCQKSNLVMKKDSDSTFIKYQKGRCEFFKVSEIHNIDSKFIFRFWTDSYVLEIKKNEDQIFGLLTFSVEDTNNKTNYFRKEFALDSKITKDIYHKITDENFNLPNLKWESGFDGNLFIYEIKNFNFYDYKSYATCCNDISEAKKYLELNDFITSLIDFKEIYNSFSNEIPFVCYKNYNGAYGTCKFEKLKTNKEIRKYNRSKKLSQ